MLKRKFAVIGHPISHTMSPFIHRRLFDLTGDDSEYTVLDIPSETLPQKIKELNELAGYNITIPNKRAIIPYLDKLDKRAQLYGSVNTVKNSASREGYTTDPDGFLKSLEEAKITLSGKVVILGCGGVARTFGYESALAGCDITFVTREQSLVKGQNLAVEVTEKISGSKVSACTVAELEKTDIFPHLVINATPVGMFPHTEDMPVSGKFLYRCENVFDAIYNPLKTVMIQTAESNGSKAVGGMSMLVWQAVSSHEIWDGVKYAPEDIAQLIEDTGKALQSR